MSACSTPKNADECAYYRRALSEQRGYLYIQYYMRAYKWKFSPSGRAECIRLLSTLSLLLSVMKTQGKKTSRETLTVYMYIHFGGRMMSWGWLRRRRRHTGDVYVVAATAAAAVDGCWWHMWWDRRRQRDDEDDRWRITSRASRCRGAARRRTRSRCADGRASRR